MGEGGLMSEKRGMMSEKRGMMSEKHGMMHRRPFLGMAALATLACGGRVAWGKAGEEYLSTMGLQLYTLRNQMAMAPAATLKRVKEVGYYQVELMDVMDADVLVPLASEHGLKVTSAFMNWQVLGSKEPKDVPTVKAVIDKAAKHGLKYLVFGYVGKGHRETLDHYKGMADRSNEAGALAKQAGIQLCYHHHSFEFETLSEGKCGFDVFVERFDRGLMKFELDVFWLAIGGRDPVKMLESLTGRVSQVHLKDLLMGVPVTYDEGRVPKEAFKEVGAGTIDMASVLSMAKQAGAAQCHVEQDQSPDPLASIETSMKRLEG